MTIYNEWLYMREEINALSRRAEQAEAENVRLREWRNNFPVTYTRDDPSGPTQIPWSVASQAYSVYSARYGRSQSLERLAERGGFGAGELDSFLPGWRDQASEIGRLRKQLTDLEAARLERATTTVNEKVERAREATTQLRDRARVNGMGFRERDPLVMAIHNALDAVADLEAARLDRQTTIEPMAEQLREVREKHRVVVDWVRVHAGYMQIHGMPVPADVLAACEGE